MVTDEDAGDVEGGGGDEVVAIEEDAAVRMKSDHVIDLENSIHTLLLKSTISKLGSEIRLASVVETKVPVLEGAESAHRGKRHKEIVHFLIVFVVYLILVHIEVCILVAIISRLTEVRAF